MVTVKNRSVNHKNIGHKLQQTYNFSFKRKKHKIKININCEAMKHLSRVLIRQHRQVSTKILMLK